MSCFAMREPLRRLDRAFAAFFRRVKAAEKPGYVVITPSSWPTIW